MFIFRKLLKIYISFLIILGEGRPMKRLASAAAIAAIAVSSVITPTTANAGDGGAVAAGVAGGLLGGWFLGQLWLGLDTMNQLRFTSLHRHLPQTAIGHTDKPIGTIGVAFGYGLVFAYAIRL